MSEKTPTPTDGYTGDVTPGGPSDVRELGPLTVRKCSVGPQDNNCYLLTCTDTKEQLLIDAADDAPRLTRLVGEGSGHLSMIVTSHRHWDHVRALAEMARTTQAATLAGRHDADDIPLLPDRRLAHGDEIVLGRQKLAVLELRGHTPGSVALAWTEPEGGRAHLFVGDCLFPGGVGNTFGDPAAFTRLIDDVEERVFAAYGDDTWIYPGHGKDTTLGAERPQLAEWRARGW
ncbi:MAG: MBL fold metallo-hydrolase [Austwickia sp.]|nr:MBL fold metallo-hydrolase [Actinomycetota bacterium]MCB1254792.1 MBL fold metallo-hydrolase [Austwickia sp.]MCO5310686.1 MBL fold metallo-hydrolase [Austwickia sp.]